ncbi:MAG: ATPase, T2SS/T4P/T4SS family [archaeon]
MGILDGKVEPRDSLKELKNLTMGVKTPTPAPKQTTPINPPAPKKTQEEQKQPSTSFDKLKNISEFKQKEIIQTTQGPVMIKTNDNEGFSWMKTDKIAKASKEEIKIAIDKEKPRSIFTEPLQETRDEAQAPSLVIQKAEKKAVEEEYQGEIVNKFDWEKEISVEEPVSTDFDEIMRVVDKPKWETGTEPSDEEKKDLKKRDAIKTSIDKMFELLSSYQKVDTGELAGYMGMDPATVERIAKLFEDDGIVEIQYVVSLSQRPFVVLKKQIELKLKEKPVGKVLDNYTIEVDYVPAEISVIIVPGEARPTYVLETPWIGKYTRKFLDFVKNIVAENMPVEVEEILDPKKSKELKKKFFVELSSRITEFFPNSPPELLNMLSGIILHEMYGLGDIELIMGDDMLEEVAINSSKTPITIYHRIHGWLKTNMYPGTEEDIMNYSSQIGRKVGREITTLSPILDAHLLSGDRVNATLFPISAEGNTLTIRRFARRPWTIVDLVGKAHTMDSQMAALLWLGMQYEMNVLIAGGTASGKTSTLNTLLALVPSYHRLISIEDVREIILPKYLEWNWVPMVTRSANPEGLGEVTMLELMISSLRMRPDRIIVGEIRRKKEAEVLMEAIETGHSIYSTMHANSAYQVLRRLAEPPMSVPLMQIEMIDLVVAQYRDRKTNKRRTYEIAEIEQTSTGQGLQVNTIFKWSPRTDSWELLNKPTKILNLLNLHTGLTEEEVFKELDDRKVIIEWLRNNNINGLNMIGYIAKTFYSDPDKIKKMARENAPLRMVQEMMN